MTAYIEFNGRRLFFHKSGSLIYLSPKREGALDELPEGYKVKYNKRGLPFCKKI